MHRLTAFVLLTAACGGSTAKPHPKTTTETTVESRPDDKPRANDADKPAEPKKDACVGFDVANLEDMLVKSDCELPGTKPDAVPNPDMKGKLEVTVAASPAKVAPGGKVELVVSFTNKTAAPMALHFRIDPVPRFETEAYDAKKKRVDMPTTNPPPPPKGHSAPPPSEVKVAKITLAPNGFARVRVPWEAVKMKWAPDRVRGTAAEKGYPRTPAGPLAKGKYTVKVVTPLVGVFEGGEHEVSAPKVEIEVGS
jgi:hypothetical protein